MKLTKDENIFVDKIAAISGKDPGTVKDILGAMLIATCLELWSGRNEINIPYLFKFSVNTKKLVKEKGFSLSEAYEVMSNPSFHKVLVQIENGDETELEKYLQREISKFLASMVDVKKSLELEDDFKERFGIQSVFQQ